MFLSWFQGVWTETSLVRCVLYTQIRHDDTRVPDLATVTRIRWNRLEIKDIKDVSLRRVGGLSERRAIAVYHRKGTILQIYPVIIDFRLGNQGLIWKLVIIQRYNFRDLLQSTSQLFLHLDR